MNAAAEKMAPDMEGAAVPALFIEGGLNDQGEMVLSNRNHALIIRKGTAITGSPGHPGWMAACGSTGRRHPRMRSWSTILTTYVQCRRPIDRDCPPPDIGDLSV